MEIEERQRKLSLWSVELQELECQPLFRTRKDPRLYDLYHLVYEPTWLHTAYCHVARNAGSKTAGCDGISIGKFEADLEGNLQAIANDLRNQTFKPHPVRRVFIPKKDGKLRPLGIPSIRDRIVQESVRMVLEPIFETEFYNLSFGFRPNRSTIDALATIAHRASNKGLYHWVIEGDIKSCFDKIHHRKLMQLLQRRIRDKKLLRLIWRFLRAGVMEGKLFTPTEEGTPQGGIVSPLLANVYLHELDRFMQRRCNLPRKDRQRRRWQWRANFVHIRYADDFVVMCNGTKAQAIVMKQELQEFLATELKLTLSEEKTKITHINDGFKFLGYQLRREITGSGVMLPKALIPQDAIRKCRHKVQAILAPSTCQQSVIAKIVAVNYYLRGWGNYYRYAYNASRVFSKLDHFVFQLLAHWLGAKFKCRLSQVHRRYYRRVDGVMTFAFEDIPLWRLSSLQFERFRQRTFTNPYLDSQPLLHREQQPEDRHVWHGNETRPGIEDVRRQVYKRDLWTCQHCGTPVDSETARLDHAKPVKRFANVQEANRMDNLQTLCQDCHTRKTSKGD